MYFLYIFYLEELNHTAPQSGWIVHIFCGFLYIFYIIIIIFYMFFICLFLRMTYMTTTTTSKNINKRKVGRTLLCVEKYSQYSLPWSLDLMLEWCLEMATSCTTLFLRASDIQLVVVWCHWPTLRPCRWEINTRTHPPIR